jgi:hypothetical protein
METPVGENNDVVRRNDVGVKIDAEVASMCKIVAEYKKIPVSQYMSEVLRPVAERDLEQHSKKFLKDKGKS